MIVDSSALVALLFQEPGYELLIDKLAGASAVGIAAPAVVEATLLATGRLGSDARPLVSRLLVEAGVETLALGEPHVGMAVEAWMRYGRGRHPAGLDFGECLSYALAALSGEPLLCTGDHFASTDLRLA